MNKTFEENIRDVRSAKKGVEVREAIAEGLEYVQQYSEDMPQQVQAAADSAKEAKAAQTAAASSAAAAASSVTAAATQAQAAADSASAASSSATAASDSAVASADSAAQAKADADRAAAVLSTDDTLTIKGAPADAKAVGDMVRPRLTVLVDAGSTVTVSKGEEKFTGTADESGEATFSLPQDGIWSVTAALMDGTAEDSIRVEYCNTKLLTLTYYTLTVNIAAGSAITATCGDSTITGTVPESGSLTLYLSGAGTWTVTATLGAKNADCSVEVTERKNYLAEIAYTKIYGVVWDGTSTTQWTRTDEAADFTDPVPYVAGAESYGSPFDDRLPWSGMVVSERTGGTMVAIPKFWYLLEQTGDGMSIKIADKKEEGFAVSPAHMDRGDGNGERDVVYVGRYFCNSSYKSKTGTTPVQKVSRATARTSIHSKGSTIWQYDFAMHFTIWLLYLVEFANWNSQEKIGYGVNDSSNASKSVGYTDSMPYHTGTTMSSRTEYGLGTQYRNIEGLWDNAYYWCDGCYNDSNGFNIILNPSDFSDSSNGTSVGIPSGSNDYMIGYPSKFKVVTKGGFPMFIATEVKGNSSTYSCDRFWFSKEAPYIYCGSGGSGQTTSAMYGLFYLVSMGTASSNLSSLNSCRFQELPNG